MPRHKVELSDRFMDDVRQSGSAAVAQHARRLLDNLAAFPDMGRVAQSPSITSRFGEGVRTLVCGKYLLVYRHAEGVVQALALYPARIVR
ncbi:MAG: type II toxin-antitoxin system RelE/ParE family toxin [Atopobiaceae bacterium]|nr:type II toxin-antitoxin system RelE/ParE family toxin [Atopobiaceae bacterium]